MKKKTEDHTFTNYDVLTQSPNMNMQGAGDFADIADLHLPWYASELRRYVSLQGTASNYSIAASTADYTMEPTR